MVWYDVIDNFAAFRQLSVQKDRLIALSAIAKQVADTMKVPPNAYKAGLWENDIHRGLLGRIKCACIVLPGLNTLHLLGAGPRAIQPSWFQRIICHHV